MTTKEFSDAFDTLLNSYNVPSGFGYSPTIGGLVLDEYEKSLFLTQAQEQLIVELYTGRNVQQSSFERTEELRSNLKSLIKTVTLSESNEEYKGISKHSKFFVLPSDVLFITYESAIIGDESAGCKDGSEIAVIPVTQDDFHRVKNNPFRQPNKRKALRLDNNQNVSEVISKYNLKEYTIRYLSKPKPIILDDLEVSIDGVSTKTECELNSILHRPILERAVLLAITSRNMQKQNNV